MGPRAGSGASVSEDGAFVAVDWGTSSFRAWRMAADGTPLAFSRGPEGMLHCASAGFAQPLFEEVTRAAFVDAMVPDMTFAFGDYDNDGFQDAVLVGWAFQEHPNLLLHNQGDGRLVDATERVQDGFASVPHGWGAVFGDYDNDGDLDLFVPMGGSLELAGGRSAAAQR